MAIETWNADTFRPELTARLVTSLTGVRDAAALARAVAESAAGPEAVCSGREMACTAGCPHCCVLNVAILLPEAMVIADWVRDRRLPAELADLRQRLEIHRSWTRWMEDEERVAKKATCPFLSDIAHCSIHPVRPLACRGVASL